MTTLQELKQHGDLVVLEHHSDGVTQDGPDPCVPGEYVGKVWANGQVWDSKMVWFDRGTYSFEVDFFPAEHTVELTREEESRRKAEWLKNWRERTERVVLVEAESDNDYLGRSVFDRLKFEG